MNKSSCKVVKVVVSADGMRKVVERSNLPIHKALALRDKLSDKILRTDWSPSEPIVSYLVEGTV